VLHGCMCMHNIIHIHSGVTWDWYYSREYFLIFILNVEVYVGIFRGKLTILHNIVVNLNNATGDEIQTISFPPKIHT